jgi:hypothetical protein
MEPSYPKRHADGTWVPAYAEQYRERDRIRELAAEAVRISASDVGDTRSITTALQALTEAVLLVAVR